MYVLCIDKYIHCVSLLPTLSVWSALPGRAPAGRTLKNWSVINTLYMYILPPSMYHVLRVFATFILPSPPIAGRQHPPRCSEDYTNKQLSQSKMSVARIFIDIYDTTIRVRTDTCRTSVVTILWPINKCRRNVVID